MLVSLSMTATVKGVTGIPSELVNDGKSFIEETKNLNMTDLKNSMSKPASLDFTGDTLNRNNTDDANLRSPVSQELQEYHRDSTTKVLPVIEGPIIMSPSGNI